MLLGAIVALGIAACGTNHYETCGSHGGLQRVQQHRNNDNIVVVCRDGYIHQWDTDS